VREEKIKVKTGKAPSKNTLAAKGGFWRQTGTDTNICKKNSLRGGDSRNGGGVGGTKGFFSTKKTPKENQRDD